MNALIVLALCIGSAVAIPANYGPALISSYNIHTAIPAPLILKSHVPLANVALASSQLHQTAYAPGYPYASQAAYAAPAIAIGHAPLIAKAPLGLGLGHGLYGGLPLLGKGIY